MRNGIAEAYMNEKAKDAAQSAADERDYARLEKNLTAVKNDIAHLSQQISEAVNALGAVAQGQARRGLRNARANVDSVMSDASDRAGAVADAAQDAASSVGDTLADMIQERPVAALAFALGLGFLIGVTGARENGAKETQRHRRCDEGRCGGRKQRRAPPHLFSRDCASQRWATATCASFWWWGPARRCPIAEVIATPCVYGRAGCSSARRSNTSSI